MKTKHILSALVGLCMSMTSAWAQWTAPIKPAPSVSTPTELTYGGSYFIQNVASGQFICAGNSWATQISLTTNGINDTTNEPLAIEIFKGTAALQGGTIYTGTRLRINGTFRSYGDREGTMTSWTVGNTYLFRIEENTGFVDYNNQQKGVLWNIHGNDYGAYYIQTIANDPAFPNAATQYAGWTGEGSSVVTFDITEETALSEDHISWVLYDATEYVYLTNVYNQRVILYNLLMSTLDLDFSIDTNDITAVYNDPDASYAELAQAVVDLQDIINNGKWDAASESNPQDVTDLLTNPDFELLNTTGWSLFIDGSYDALGYQRASYTNGDVTISHFVEAWRHQNNGTLGDGYIQQTVTDLPAGKYMLEADIIAVNQGNASTQAKGAYLFAQTGSTEMAKEVPTGNEKPQHFELTFIHDGSEELTLGVKTESTTANWLAADNFRLTYYGPSNDSQERIKLQEAIDAAQNFDTTQPAEQALKDAFANALSAAQTAYFNNNSNEYIAARNNLQQAQQNLQASVEAYLYLSDYMKYELTYRISWSEDVAHWTDLLSQLTSLQTELQNGYNQGTIDTNTIPSVPDRVTTIINEYFANGNNIQPGDNLTILIRNAHFLEGNGQDIPGWTIAEGTAATLDANYHNAESYQDGNTNARQTLTDISQVIANLPAGHYTLSVQGFCRTDYSQSAELYANNSSAAMKHLTDEHSETPLTDGTAPSGPTPEVTTNDGYYVPNSMYGAYVYFEKDFYWNYLTFDHLGGNMTIGIRTTTEAHNRDWVIWDNFQLIYQGELEDTETVTVRIDANNGSWSFGNAAGTYNRQWSSTAPDLGVTLTEGSNRNNMNYYDGTNAQLYTGYNGQPPIYNTQYIIAPKSSEYRIAAVSLDFRSDSEEGISVSINDGEAVENYSTSEYVNISASDMDSQSVTINVASLGSSNHYVQTQNFIVTLKKIQQGDQQVIDEFRQVAQEAQRLLNIATNCTTGEHETDGLITDASQFSSPYSHNEIRPEEPDGGNLSDGVLIDGNTATYWHSAWYSEESGIKVTPGTHYFQVELNETEEAMDIIMAFTRRNNAYSDHCTEWGVYGTNESDAEKGNCTLLGTLLTPYVKQAETLYSTLFNTQGYRYIRFYFEATTPYNNGWSHLSEFQLYRATAFQNLYDATGEAGTELNSLVNLSDADITPQKLDELRAAIPAFNNAINAALAVSHEKQETPTELVNLDFSQGTPLDNGVCTYDYDREDNNTTYFGTQYVYGWSTTTNQNAMAGGLFEYGTSAFLGNAANTVPSVNPDGQAVGNALGLLAVWTATAQYTQRIKLAAGDYTMRVPVYNTSGASPMVKNLIGFIADNGTEYLATTKEYPVGKWKTESVSFTLSEDTEGYLTLGYTSDSKGYVNMPHLFIDCVKFVGSSDEFNKVKEITQEVNLYAYTDWYSYSAWIDKSQITSALNISDISEATLYALNRDGSIAVEGIGEWRDASGNVCTYDQIGERGMYFSKNEGEDYIYMQVKSGSNFTPEETYTARWAYIYDYKAVIFNIVAKFIKYEESIQDGDIAVEGTENNTACAKLSSNAEGEVTIPTNSNNGFTITGLASQAFAQATALKAITLPETITEIPSDAFDGCNAPAIIWKSNTKLPDEAFQNYGIPTDNLLLFVNDKNLAPAGVKNVIVDNKAEEIVLTDGNAPFYCPQEFEAKSVSYTHTFNMTTGINGNAAGWETITLPFEVDDITHVATGATLKSFDDWTVGDDSRPFWLYELGSKGFTSTKTIKADTPYIIAMPNNSIYPDEYNITGEVTFTSRNADFYLTRTHKTIGKQDEKRFQPNYDILPAENSRFVINSVNVHVDRSNGEVPGSRFVAGESSVYPFEAYIENSSNSVKGAFLEIQFEGDATALPSVPFDARLLSEGGNIVYNTSGQAVRRLSSTTDMSTLLRGLPAGIYIVNGQKVAVGK